MKKVKKKTDSGNYSKWMKISAWSAIALVVLVVISTIITQTLSIISGSQLIILWVGILQSFFGLILNGLFFFGFYKIGNRYNSKILKIVSVLIILFYVVSLIVQYSYFQQVSAELGQIYLAKATGLVSSLPANATEEQANQAFSSLFQILLQDEAFVEGARIILFLFIAYSLILGILTILVGVALIRLKEKIHLARQTGILLIVGVLTSIIIVGLFVLLVAFIMQIMMLFRESSKK